jgi:hypothetical protein
MTNERATPGAGFWAAVILMAVPFFYFVSIGPVAWGESRWEDSQPEWVENVVNVYFIPATIVYEVSPEPVRFAMAGYCDLFSGR